MRKTRQQPGQGEQYQRARQADLKAAEARLAFEAAPTDKNFKAMTKAMAAAADARADSWSAQNAIPLR